MVYHELGRTKQLVFELEEARAESKRKSFFLNAISHDLRTPLNGLMLQAELAELSDSSSDEESLRESLREIKACARTTADLLGSFLELGRLDWSDDPNRESRFLVADSVTQVLKSVQSAARQKGLILHSRVPEGLNFRTDRVKLERMLQNLVGNAVKFTEHGSVEVVVISDGGDAVIQVTDTGVGIPTSRHETIFEEFFQVGNCERDSSKGFGLGLSITRRLAKRLGGDLAVESEVGRGSQFTLALTGVVDRTGSGGSPGEPGPLSRLNHAPAALG